MLMTAPSCEGDRLTPEERQLFDLINAWRQENGRHAIPFSASLTVVANRHVRDLDQNVRKLGHSWSDCAYVVGNRSTYDCMWRAPQRLGTRYRANGYENTYVRLGGDATAQGAIERWKGSDLHNGVILNTMGGGIDWGRFTWRALGVGIHGSFAVMWVGDQTDPDRTPMGAAAPPGQWLALRLDALPAPAR